jgi:hypothetical protein
VGKLYDEIQRIEQQIAARNLDLYRVRGKIALRAGFPLLSIRPDTPDDADRLARLVAAATQILSDS